MTRAGSATSLLLASGSRVSAVSRGPHRDQLEGVDRARLAVDGEDEVVGGEAGDGAPVLVDHDCVDRDEVDARAEHGLLRVTGQGHDDEGDGEGEPAAWRFGAPLYHRGSGVPRRPQTVTRASRRLRFNLLDSGASKNWIYGLPKAHLRNPNAVPTSATGMKPAISRLVTDSLRFVIF